MSDAPHSQRGRTPPAEAGWTTLDRVLAGIWSSLARAAASAKSPWHAPGLATTSPDGHPSARTVILRACDAEARTLICHTDRRADKLGHVAAQPRVAWLFYDAPRKVQLRAEAIATVHTDDALADERWAASSLSSRRCYLAPHTPGEPVPAEHAGPHPNLPDDLRDRVPSEDETTPGRAHFAVIRTRITAFDWLYLKHDGHRRARFAWDDGGRLTASWIMP